jgi:murein DD-endopeptidase MepM/ murein hydrolase activator NlpD
MMLNNESQKLPLPIRSAALFFVGIVLVLLAVFMPADDAEGAGIGEGYVFPLPAPHTYGDGWGAGRNHQGQDLFADCGRNLVAVNDGRIQVRDKNRGGWGNYIVLDVEGTKVDFLYAHMQRTNIASQGQRVSAGEKVGKVGETGNASGCHVHFEMWSKPGFGEGGGPMREVTRHLREWDETS